MPMRLAAFFMQPKGGDHGEDEQAGQVAMQAGGEQQAGGHQGEHAEAEGVGVRGGEQDLAVDGEDLT